MSPQRNSTMHDWVPIRLYAQDGRLMVDWCHMGETRFTEPFFAETVEKRLRDPFALLFRHQTPIDALVELEQASPGLAPGGFVLHMSRCGSTLITQMLAGFDDTLVLSEPPPVDELLRARLQWRDVSDERWAITLRALVSAMTQRRTGAERRCFVKLDAWHVLAMPLIRRAFPDVPWIFVHRHPVEVMVSHQRQMSAQMMPGGLPPALFGVDAAELRDITSEEYTARVLAAICDGARAHLGDGGLAVAYADLPDATWTSIAAHFGLDLTTHDVETMRRAAGMDAKRPERPYSDDSASKRDRAGAATRQAADRWAMSSWRQLDPGRVETLAGRS